MPPVLVISLYIERDRDASILIVQVQLLGVQLRGVQYWELLPEQLWPGDSSSSSGPPTPEHTMANRCLIFVLFSYS